MRCRASKIYRKRRKPAAFCMQYCCALLQSCCHDGFDGMHAVIGFIENDGTGTFKNLIRDFHAINAEFLKNGFTDCGIQVMEGRQCMNTH